MLLRNDLIEYLEPDKKLVRILWLAPNGKNAVTYNINSHGAKPELIDTEPLREDLLEGRAKLVKPDPLLVIADDDKLSEKSKSIRERAWKLVRPLVEDEPSIYSADRRWKLISACAKHFNTTHKTIYFYLRRYWERGQSPNALLPDYKNSGGKGQTRTSKTGIKRGRPRKFSTGREVNVDREIRRIFSTAATRFYVSNSKFSLRGAYDEMIKEFFLDKSIDPESKTVTHSYKESQEGIPSFDQFQYWLGKDLNRFYARRQRLTPRIYDKDLRGLLGTSNQEVWGPGARFQIDATIADVFLVSRLNPSRIIGRPVLYIVIDVFSRMIVGMYVGLEGPSWVGAMMALANTASDKQAYCKKFGREIEKEEWPCEHLPSTLLGDRGEIAARAIETLQKNFNVDVENSAPYRADWKGIVEQRFKLIPSKFKAFVPGYIEKDYRARGGHDYRLDAKLNLDQFTQIIIECVLYYNNQHQLKQYDQDRDLAADNIPKVPLELWEWGIQNRTGKLRHYPEDAVRFSLMPVADASVTSNGIRFQGQYYTCKKAMDELWFDRARQEGRWKVKISYDPRDGDFVYLHDDSNNLNFHICSLTERSRAYKNLSWQEINQQLYDEEKIAALHAPRQQLANANFTANMEAIVENATKMPNENVPLSAASQTKNIRQNRAKEKLENRANEAFHFKRPSHSHPNSAQIIQFPGQDDDDFSEPDITEIFDEDGGQND